MAALTAETVLKWLWARWANTHTAHAVCVAMVILAGLAFRVFEIEEESPWHDEALSVLHLDATSLSEFLGRIHAQDPIPGISPLYFIAEYGWSCVCGVSVVAVRLLSVMWSLGCITLLYLIGRRLFGPGAGLIGALAYSLSFVNVYYAQEIRFYAQTSFFALLAILALLRAMETGRKRDWAAYTLAIAALLWTHALAGLFFAPQALFLAYSLSAHRPRVLPALASQILVALAFGAWVLALGYDVEASTAPYRDMPGSWREFANALLVFTGGRYDNRDLSSVLPAGVSFDYFIAITTAVLVAGLVFKQYRPGGAANAVHARERSALVLLILWLIVPPVLLFALSHAWRPIFYYRYVLYSSCAVYLLLGAAIVRLNDTRIRIGLAAALLVALAYQNLATPRPLRPHFQWAAALIEAIAAPDAEVYPFKPLTELPFRCSSRLPGSRIRGYEGFPELCHDAAAAARAGREVWTIFTLWSRTGDFEEHMRAAGLEARQYIYPGPAPITLFQVPAYPQAHQP